MKNLLKAFINDTSAAITVEWVVLVAAIVGIAIAVLTFLAPGIGALASRNANVLSIEE